MRKKLRTSAKRSRGGLARKIDRGFAPGEKLTPRQTAIVAESEGLPGVTYSKAIAPGESGYQPGVRNPDDATPSLFQITPSVQSAETQAKFDKIASKRKGGYSNPIVAAKQAKVLAKGSSDAGVSNYVAFDPSAPQGHLPGGQKRARKRLYGERKPIPKKVRNKAERVLGEKRTERVIEKARTPQGPKKKPGGWAGSKRAVLGVVPKTARAEGKGDKRTPEENTAVGGSSTSDHLTTNTKAYAADLPADDKLARKIASKIGLPSHTGTNEVVKDGYRYQLIWQDAGHYDHIHLGVSWVGAGVPQGTVAGAAGGSLASGGRATGAPLTTGGTAAPTSTATRGRKVRRRRNRQKQAVRLIEDLIAKEPAKPVRSKVELTTTPYAERVRRKAPAGLS